MRVDIAREGNLIQGSVLDVARAPLLAALRRYDQQLYLKWNSKKREGRGLWELRRKPEFKSVRPGRMIESPRGKVYIPGDVFEFEGLTICVPKYHENHIENHVKDFDVLGYHILDWVASKDLWKFGYKGRDTMNQAEYLEAKYDEKIDNDSADEKNYMIKQHRTQFNDFRNYINSGGSPHEIMRYWNKA